MFSTVQTWLYTSVIGLRICSCSSAIYSVLSIEQMENVSSPNANRNRNRNRNCSSNIDDNFKCQMKFHKLTNWPHRPPFKWQLNAPMGVSCTLTCFGLSFGFLVAFQLRCDGLKTVESFQNNASPNKCVYVCVYIGYLSRVCVVKRGRCCGPW